MTYLSQCLGSRVPPPDSAPPLSLALMYSHIAWDRLWMPPCTLLRVLFEQSCTINTCVTVLSLLEMHSGGNVRGPRCRPFSPGILGASDLILIYYWGGLCSAAPTGSGPCSAVLRHLRAANALVHVELNEWAGSTVTRPKRVNLGIHRFGADLEGGDLVRRTKQKSSDIL